jgi:putative membrane protein
MKPTIVPTIRAGFRHNRVLQGLVVWLCLVWLAAAIAPYNRFDWLLENLLVIVYGILLVFTYRMFPFSNFSYFLFTVFMTLHLMGAHYTYAETPLGYWLQDLFALTRNHYDRIVHFAYGLLLAYPLREMLMRLAGLRGLWASLITINVILAFSGFFEIIETVIAMIVSPELGDAYLGTQGDIWDAQRDMLAAMIGGILAMLITNVVEKRTAPGKRRRQDA